MECTHCHGQLNRYIDGELGYVEVAELQQHLGFCPDCAAELRELSALRGTLAAWGGTALAPSPGFAERVMAGLAAEPAPGSPRPLGQVVDETLDTLDRALGHLPLPGGRKVPVKNVIGWALAVIALVEAGRRRGRREREARSW
ncbi:MAG TPA: anti-sigma factor [Thermoleophilia bacterium]|nr:anti-sigma factor [Thermoleophilia bacterium]